ncbi:sensor histidine kinase [Longispora fulva]|uniref:Signal transduction histidine-protein kinase/phosphatase MprB n=1 Tax=Longispora fulva TaxID=619741 RepID=A0A8J7GHA3_9ACTN|nr:HAMP domain-containing sensor histidine kinase [Longispora fulva]MBG6137936.1 signal transduction histidine kinase [Longispora fulva]
MRRRFVLVALAVGALVTLAWAVPLAAVAYHSTRTQVLFQAERDADALAQYAQTTTDPAELRKALAAVPAERQSRLGLTLPNGTTIGGGRHASEEDFLRARVNHGAITVSTPKGTSYLTAADGVVIEGYVPSATLTHEMRTAWGLPALLGLVLLVIACFVASWMARGAVRASEELAFAARRLGAGDTHVRVVPGGPPEIATAGAAFNEMAERLRILLANERELLADLSHRLRTPLTALRLNAEALPPGLERDRVLDAARQTEHELSSIIEEAREPLHDVEPARCDIAAVAADRTKYWAVLAADQHRAWRGKGLTGQVPVAVGRADAASALDTVLGNVFQHTPPGTAYQVSVLAGEDRVRLVVDDAGPGIGTPDEAMLRGVSGGESTGLGLDIARRVAESTGGALTVGPSPLGGTRITLAFRR